MRTAILDRSPREADRRHPLAVALAWWEGRRPWFTLVIVAAGLYGATRPEFGQSFGPFALWHTLLELGCWAVAANICYCAGYLLEAMLYHYVWKTLRSGRLRWVLFLLGTAVVTLVFYAWASVWYFPILWWLYL